MPNHPDPTQGHLTGPATVLVSEVRMVSLDVPGERGGEVPVSLTYDPQDPYAVALVFHTAEGDVTWMVARELLVVGAGSPTGDGDVMVWPALTPDLLSPTVNATTDPAPRALPRPTRDGDTR